MGVAQLHVIDRPELVEGEPGQRWTWEVAPPWRKHPASPCVERGSNSDVFPANDALGGECLPE